MSIKASTTWPVNELGEIVATAGVGSTNVVYNLSQDLIPTDETTGKIVIVGGLDVSPDITNIVRDSDGNISTYMEGPYTFKATYNTDGDLTSLVRQ